MLPFQANYRAPLEVVWKIGTIKIWALNEFLTGQDFLAKRSISVSYKSVSYMRDSTVLKIDWKQGQDLLFGICL